MRLLTIALLCIISAKCISQDLQYNHAISFLYHQNEKTFLDTIKKNGYFIGEEESTSANNQDVFDKERLCVLNSKKVERAIRIGKKDGNLVGVTFMFFDIADQKKVVSIATKEGFAFEEEKDNGTKSFIKGNITMLVMNETLKGRTLYEVVLFMTYPNPSKQKKILKYRAIEAAISDNIDSLNKEVWLQCDLLVVVNRELKKIKIYSAEVQEYDLASTGKTVKEKAGTQTEFDAINENGEMCRLMLLEFTEPIKGIASVLIVKKPKISYVAYRLKDAN